MATEESRTSRSSWGFFAGIIKALPPIVAAVVSVIAALLLFGATLVAVHIFQWSRSSTPAMSNVGPTVTQLQEMRQIVATKVHVTDILTGEGEGYKGSWFITGDALIMVDAHDVKVTRDDETRTATIVLKPPWVTQPRVDHERSKKWDIKKTTWIPFAGDQDALRDAAMMHAQRLIYDAASREEYRAAAREMAARMLEKIYGHVGWTVNVEWSDGGGETIGHSGSLARQEPY